MANLWGREMTREEILKRVGDISQIGGVKLAELSEGVERGVRIAEVNSGGGLIYTVLLDRGMDIAWTSFKGISVSWRSATRNLAPAFFEPEGLGWLRGFHGGLMNTCGLTYAGAAGRDKSNHPFLEEEDFGLHGRASYLPASNLWVDGAWQGDDYLMWVQGKIKESIVFGDKIALYRKIWSRLGGTTINIEDQVVNEGWNESPFMILYHINFGYPLLDDGARLFLPVEKTVPRDEMAEEGKEEWHLFSSPQKGYFEKVYLHYPKTLEDGYGASLLVNDRLKMGVYVKFSKDVLPYFTEWKMMGEGEYVLGMEPGNCFPLGRRREREEGRLVTLQPGESKKISLEIGILEGEEKIEQFKKYLKMS